MGLKRPSMSNIEKGRQNILLHTFCDIVETLDVKASDLLLRRYFAHDPVNIPDLRLLFATGQGISAKLALIVPISRGTKWLSEDGEIETVVGEALERYAVTTAPRSPSEQIAKAYGART